MDLTAYRGRIGVVPQEPALFNDTVENNIRYGNPGEVQERIDCGGERSARARIH